MSETDAFAALYGRLSATTLAPGGSTAVALSPPADRPDRPSTLLTRLAPLRPKPLRRKPTWHLD